ncbi:MAG: acyl-ACP--UDP-N-acetylglucosamine O-acyltransferase [Gammaproteobacteria bacterium]
MIDARALVDPSAHLADDVAVGPFAVIGAEVEIGPGCVIGAHANVLGPTRIGRDNRIFQFASLGGIPQDMKYHGERTWLEIGDRNSFFEFVTVNRGTLQAGGKTVIGSDNWIMAYVHIAHDCRLGDHLILANNTTLAGHVTIEDWAALGGFTKVHQFCRIGRHSFTGMNADLTRDIPPYVIVSGTPAEPHGINSVGLRRRGFSDVQIRNIKNAYRVLYRSKLRLEEARSELGRLAVGRPELTCLVEFLASSERSITR